MITGQTKGRTSIVAEAGVNHNGSIELAVQMVDVAAEAGADVIKFQTFKAEEVVSRHTPKADYQKSTTGNSETHLEMAQKLELDDAAHRALYERCQERAIEFLSSPFDLRSLHFLAGDLGVSRIKVASGEITNLPYLRHVGRYAMPVILSTGMATLGEIEGALAVLEQAGTPRKRITVLHCNTEYPTPMSDVNLRAMLTIGEAFGVAVGYSDHTLGIEVPIAAAALGATVIEKHFTLDRTLPGPDHNASLEPDELKSMVAAVRRIEQALGDGVKRPSVSEEKNILIVRRSLVAACDIRVGELFSETNLAVKRPGTGLSPMRWDEVMGREAPRDFAADELIEL